jgi:hypothetical protein
MVLACYRPLSGSLRPGSGDVQRDDSVDVGVGIQPWLPETYASSDELPHVCEIPAGRAVQTAYMALRRELTGDVSTGLVRGKEDHEARDDGSEGRHAGW